MKNTSTILNFFSVFTVHHARTSLSFFLTHKKCIFLEVPNYEVIFSFLIARNTTNVVKLMDKIILNVYLG
jgi:hypothetical protein